MPLTFSYLPLQKQRQLRGKCALWIVWLLEMYQEDHRIFPLLLVPCSSCSGSCFCISILAAKNGFTLCVELIASGKVWSGRCQEPLATMQTVYSDLCQENLGGGGRRRREGCKKVAPPVPPVPCCPCVPQLSSSCTKHSSCPITPAQNTPPPALSPLHLLSHSLL